ncbi:MAG TPA: hypothetical protein VLK65_03185 [Vicinamibacteria bacterium]|nr:hypothetical protein [Vicinamibacteria bacterium]
MLSSIILSFLVSSPLVYDAPKEWTPSPSTSSMRLAQWKMGTSSEVVIFYFGPGQGGGVEANLERWYGQFVQPDGSATREHAQVRKMKVGNLDVTRADVSGTYVAPVRPGASDRHDEKDYRMIAAVVEGPSGPWFIRLLGPQAEVSAAEASFDAFLTSLRIS